jgi:hypothetical protein
LSFFVPFVDNFFGFKVCLKTLLSVLWARRAVPLHPRAIGFVRVIREIRGSKILLGCGLRKREFPATALGGEKNEWDKKTKPSGVFNGDRPSPFTEGPEGLRRNTP